MGDRRDGVKRKMLPPDGGWGWMIVIGSCFINVCTRAIEPSFGLLFGDLLRDLGVATTAAAVVVSVMEGTLSFTGFFVGPLMKKYSCRKMAIVGSLLSTTALICTSLATSLTHIIISYSIIGGLGFGFVSAASLVALNTYFDRRRGQAVGLAMAGTACGFMLMPQLISRLLAAYDFRDTMLILGAVSLHALPGSCLLQPVKWHMRPATVPSEQQAPLIQNKEVELQDLKTISNERGEKDTLSTLSVNEQNTHTSTDSAELARQNSCEPNVSHRKPFNRQLTRESSVTSYSRVGGRRKKTSSSLSAISVYELMGSNIHIHEFQETDSEDDSRSKLNSSQHVGKISQSKPNNNSIEENAENKKTKKGGCWKKIADIFDLDLLMDFSFLNLIFGISLTYLAEANFKLVVPFFMANLGYTKSEIAQMLSIMGMADIVACVILPPINDRLSFPHKNTLMLGLFLLSIARSVLAEQTTWLGLMITLILHGFCRGFALTNFPLVISDALSMDKFAAGLGICRVFKGIFVLLFGPLVGWVRDYTGSFSLCLHFQALMNMICVLSWFIEYLFFTSKKPQQLDPS